ncbi:MAG: hypothetical protein ACI9OJ_003852 [Myxococcota bacterium]|jgi:hypothetical protein
MRRPFYGPLLALMASAILVQVGCKKDAPKDDPKGPAAASEAASPEKDEPKPTPPRHVTLGVADMTTEAERPADVSKHFKAIIEHAAAETGFTLVEDGNKGGLVFYYALSNDGKVDPKLDRGMITWGVQAEVSIVGEDDLSTTFEGVGRGEAPFVRAALPNLDEAFKEVLQGAAVTALRDIDMQIRYEDVSEAEAVKGLTSRHPEEVWAGLRRLGELGATESTEAIIDALADGDKLTQIVAGGVLVRLQDKSAIAPLSTVAMEITDPASVVFVADVINQLGGDDAKAAVSKLTKSHPNEEARAALSRGLPSEQP